MYWFLAAVSSALFFSILNVVTKKLTKDTSGIIYSTLFSLSATIIYTPFFIYFITNTKLTTSLIPWLALLASGLANSIGIIAYNSSIKYGEISEVIPLTKLTPIFTAILGYTILDETINTLTGLGITAVTTGSYIVLLKKDVSPLEPFKRLTQNKALLLATSTSIIYAFASIADRFSTQAIPPHIYVYFIFLTMTTTMLTYLTTKNTKKLVQTKKTLQNNLTQYTAVGILAISAYLTIFIAYSQAPASKVVPILQLQVLASVAAGGYLFNEKNMLRKIIGSLILITGVILLTL